MKACVIQPPYFADYDRSEECYRFELAELDACTPELDLIVLPESCDVPCYADTAEKSAASIAAYQSGILSKASETAARCKALVFVNVSTEREGKRYNTTVAFDRDGKQAGLYFKQHLTPREVYPRGLGSDYTFEYSAPTILELDGLRFAFLTCYDFYFYEAFSAIARLKPDIIIGCSHQRTDSHDALETMTKFLAYNTCAYVVRASVSMGKDSGIGGKSMIVAPDGRILADMESRLGSVSAEFDPRAKYTKPAGFGGAPMTHHEYVERGRRPYKYHPAGSAIVKPDDICGYPRLCAHRGFNSVAPENSMPAFGAAVALGADEIEFDLWLTSDGEVVSLHDPTLERVSDGEGSVCEKTYAELCRYDFGVKAGERFRGLRIVRFEEILAKFSCHVIMNIHLKTINNKVPFDQAGLQKIIALIRQYDCEKYVYFMSGNDRVLAQLAALAPDIPRVCGAGDAPRQMVERAVAYGCKKIQLFKPMFDKDMIDRAHAAGLLCNVFWSDDPDEAERFLDMGIDTILTNDYQRMADRLGAKLHTRPAPRK